MKITKNKNASAPMITNTHMYKDPSVTLLAQVWGRGAESINPPLPSELHTAAKKAFNRATKTC